MKESGLVIERVRLSFATYYNVSIEGDKGGIRLWIYKDNPRELFLSDLYVKEQYRNTGLGQGLLDYSQKAARKLGIKRLALKVIQDTWMESWYMRCGYPEDTSNQDSTVRYLYKDLCS